MPTLTGNCEEHRPLLILFGQIRRARDLLTRPENTVTSIAKLLGVSRNTIYKYVPELKGGRITLDKRQHAGSAPPGTVSGVISGYR
ncbi:helix-turn-helix domain-containing protein [Streptomyces goshikiensis]|uniref:helix-turn-helix domain-containing protein n=1 Tax=Streptomyces goshikiensis TaxID=1942 RepID=UPI00365B2502